MQLVVILSLFGLLCLSCQGRMVRNELREQEEYNEENVRQPYQSGQVDANAEELWEESEENWKAERDGVLENYEPPSVDEDDRFYKPEEDPELLEEEQEEEKRWEEEQKEEARDFRQPVARTMEDDWQADAMREPPAPAGVMEAEVEDEMENEVEESVDDDEVYNRALGDMPRMEEEQREEEKAARMMAWWFKFPGTNYCGRVKAADSGKKLGKFKTTDACCKAQHSCGEKIGKNQTRFGLKNTVWFPMSECSCDREFKKCLNAARRYPSKAVKKIYFSFMPCFNLEDGKATAGKINE